MTELKTYRGHIRNWKELCENLGIDTWPAGELPRMRGIKNGESLEYSEKRRRNTYKGL